MTSALRTLAGQIALLAVAALGGFVFSVLDLPAPWLSGAMIATVLLCASGRAPVMHWVLRDAAMLVAGLSMGTAVTPGTLNALAAYPVSLVLLALCMVTLMGLLTFALTRLRGWDARDAFFASAPGALSSVLAIAVEEKVDVPRIAIVQIIRLFVLVAVLPGLIETLENKSAAPLPVVAAFSLPALVLVFAAGLAGGVLLARLRVTAPLVLGAMLGSACLTGPGLVVGQMPPLVTSAGTVLVGAFIGLRFQGVQRTLLIRLLPDALLSVVIGLVVAGAFAELVALLTGTPFDTAMVALAPGGLEVMTMLAFSLGLDQVFVGVHHTARFLLIGAWVPLALKLFPSLLPPRRPAPNEASRTDR